MSEITEAQVRELLPCPFCGNECPTVSEKSYGVTIRCPNCQIAFELDGTCGRDRDKAATIKAWNRRRDNHD